MGEVDRTWDVTRDLRIPRASGDHDDCSLAALRSTDKSQESVWKRSLSSIIRGFTWRGARHIQELRKSRNSRLIDAVPSLFV